MAQKKKNYKENKNVTLIQKKNIVKIAEILFDYFYGD